MKRLFFTLCAMVVLLGGGAAQNCKPELLALNGLSTNLRPMDSDGNGITDQFLAPIYVHDLLLYAHSTCVNGPLKFGLIRSQDYTGMMPADTVIYLNCNDFNLALVQLWVQDTAGNTNFVETFVQVDIPLPGCDAPVPALPVGCNPDKIPAQLVLYNGFAVNVSPGTNSPDKAALRATHFIRAYRDNCGPVQSYRIGKVNGNFSAPPGGTALAFNCPNLGNQYVVVWAKDGAGGWSYALSFVTVEDNFISCDAVIPPAGCQDDQMMPNGRLYNGLVSCLPPSGQMTVWASDFVQGTRDNCSTVNNDAIRISKYGYSPTPPTSTSVTFDCSELGVQLVSIWLADQAGNWNRIETYVLVEDNWGVCGPAQKPQRFWPETLDDVLQQQ